MWGRLGIFVFVGIQDLIKAARDIGHDLTLSKTPIVEGMRSVPEDTQLGVLEDGSSIVGVIGTVCYEKMLYEFLSVKGFLDYLSVTHSVKEELLKASSLNRD